MENTSSFGKREKVVCDVTVAVADIMLLVWK